MDGRKVGLRAKEARAERLRYLRDSSLGKLYGVGQDKSILVISVGQPFSR